MKQTLKRRAVAALLAVAVIVLAGCAGTAKVAQSLPPGSQLQSSTFGVQVSPSAVDGTTFNVGSHSTIFTTAQPKDAGVNLNRFEGKAPAVHVKSTVASGPIGEQIKAAGGPAALNQLLGHEHRAPIPRAAYKSPAPDWNAIPPAGFPLPLTSGNPRATKREPVTGGAVPTSAGSDAAGSNAASDRQIDELFAPRPRSVRPRRISENPFEVGNDG